MSYNYIKILTDDLIHREYQWKLGRNDLPSGVVFDKTKNCTANALYVCRIDDFFEWVTMLYSNMKWVAYASIPDDAEYVYMDDKIKASSVILHGPLIPITEFIPIAIQNDGAAINIRSRSDWSLCWASNNNYLEMVKFARESGADLHVRDNYPIRYASSNGYLEIVEYLLGTGCVDVHADDDGALRGACMNGHLEVVICLVEKGHANIHAKEDYALRMASEEGHLKIVKYLMTQGAKIYPCSALSHAANKGHLDIVKYFIENWGCECDTNLRYALRLAIDKGHTEIAKYIKEQI